MSTSLRSRVLAMTLALLALLMAFACWRIGWAAWSAKPAQDALVRMDAGQQVDADRIAKLAAGVVRSRELQPRAGIYDELAARLALHAARTAQSPLQRVDALELAQEAALRAQSARPVWPYAALLVAASEDAAGQHGTQFVDAVDAAWLLGRHEARIGETLAGLWLRADARRAAPALGAAFDAQLAVLPEAWIDRADRSGVADAACQRAASNLRARERCTLLGWRDPRTTGAAPASSGQQAHDADRHPG